MLIVLCFMTTVDPVRGPVCRAERGTGRRGRCVYCHTVI